MSALSVLVLVAVVVGLGISDTGQRWWREYTHDTRPPAPVGLADLVPADSLKFPEQGTESPVAAAIAAATAPKADPAKVRAALRSVVKDPALSKRLVVEVADLAGGDALFTSGPGRFTPASTTKILTAVAALQAMPAETTFDTRVVLGQPSAGQKGEGQKGAGRAKAQRIVLVGGGDPFLASTPQADATVTHRADLQTLARRTATALKQRGLTTVVLDRDTSLFTGPSNNPQWQPDYVPDGVVSPIVALWADMGRDPDGYGRVANPAAAATATFAAQLRTLGITVRPASREVTAGASAEEVAVVRSAPLSQIVEHVLQVSDNEGAEILSHQVGLAVEKEGSFAAGIRGTEKMLSDLDVDLNGWQQFDGSGLSRHNRFAPQTLVDALRVAAASDHPNLRAVITGLPVAGFNGSLSGRFVATEPQARGMVRAKTGTLTGVHGLAGLITSTDGAVMVYVAVADRVPVEDTGDARLGLERISAALAACRCAAPAES